MRIRLFRSDKYQADAGLVNGKRLRQVFNSKKAAEPWLRVQKETKRKFRLGLRALGIDQAADALMRLQILDRHATLVDAARFWKEHHKHESTRKLGYYHRFYRTFAHPELLKTLHRLNGGYAVGV